MLKIVNKNEIVTDDESIFQLLADYSMISGYVYRRLVEEFGADKAKDFMLHKLVKMVTEVEKEV